jgi:hypothetical protein
MNLSELYKPKIGKKATDAAFTYFRGKQNSDDAYSSGGVFGFQDKLSKLGWEPLGNGNFSSVFVNPKKNYVLKITDKPDPGYAEYVALIKKTRNKHFPKISDLKMLSFPNLQPPVRMMGHGMVNRPDTEYYVYLIEKLYPITYVDDVNKSAVGRYCYLVAYFHYETLTKIFADREMNVPRFLRNDPSLVDALKYVGKNASLNVWLDIHGSNIMQRDDGTVVITDPYAKV